MNEELFNEVIIKLVHGGYLTVVYKGEEYTLIVHSTEADFGAIMKIVNEVHNGPITLINYEGGQTHIFKFKLGW